MKLRFITIFIIFAVLLSSCSTKSKQAVVNKNSSNIIEEQYKPEEKPSVDVDLKDNTKEKSTSDDSSETQTLKDKKEENTTESDTLSQALYTYLSTQENRASVGDRANELHGGTMHNSCVYFASEALRRAGVKIPDSMAWIPTFIEELESQGFKTSYDLEQLKPGDICFTTDVNGVVGGRPTHAYIFMGWESPGVAWIADNQVYDYGDVYHTRSMEFHYLKDMKDKPKEATAFFMYK